MTRLLLAAVFVLGAAPALALAQPMGNPDLDHDGKVTLDEFRNGGSAAAMARLDRDKDGRISRTEFDALVNRIARFAGPDMRSRAVTMWGALDADQDGFATREEQAANQKRRFDAADTNNDGWLSKGELLMMRQNRARGG